MIKFLKKRTTLTKELLKKKRGGDVKELEAFFKKLKDNQLEMLHLAVQTEGENLSGCVLLPKDKDPHVLCCQAWRWPTIQNVDIRRLPVCKSASDVIYICCNPYHWSRLYIPDTPPPYYIEQLQPEDRAPSEAALVFRESYPSSLTTYGEDSAASKGWCKLAYWEKTRRVGRQFPVEKPFINIFWDIPYGDGLSVKQLSDNNNSFSPEDVDKARKKIGLGITLSREDNGIWVYNRSDIPIFVNSLTLENNIDSPSPTRVPMEHCLCVFDTLRSAHRDFTCNIANCNGPIDKNSVRISFGKGWGRGYSRMEITSCPCWIEILLAPCR